MGLLRRIISYIMHISINELEVLPRLDARIPNWDTAGLHEQPCCPLSAERAEPPSFKRPDGLPVSYCAATGLWFCAKRPNIEKLDEFYRLYYRSHCPIKFDSAWAQQLKKGLPKYDLRNIVFKKIRSILGAPTGKRLLDVGMGTGLFVAHAKRLGYDCSGVDVAEDAVQYLSKTLNIKCIAGKLEAWACREKFDVISMLDVVEHFLNPLDVLFAARRMLSEKGILVIWTPNGGEAGDRAGTARMWTGFRVDLEHMQYLSPKTIVWLGNKLNMDVLHLEAIGYPGAQGVNSRKYSNYYAIRKYIGDCFPYLRMFRQWYLTASGQSVDHRLGQYHLFAILQAR